MKYFKNDKVYVNFNDLINMPQLASYSLPGIIRKGLGENYIVIDESNRFNFAEFDLPEEVEYFKNQDWIIDYDEYKFMTDEELEEAARRKNQEIQLLIESYNNLSEEEQMNSYHMIRQHRRLWHQLQDLKAINLYRNNELNLDVPEESDLDIQEEVDHKVNEIIFDDICKTKEKSLIKRLIDNINNRSSANR